MSPRSYLLDADTAAYVAAHCEPADPVHQEITAETAARFPDATGMQIGPEQAALLTLLTRLTGARTAVEVGTFTGASALAIARGLAPDGRLTCCDVSEEYTSVARAAWERAGLADRIELRIAPALDTLATLPEEPHVDLAFIDADKPSYPAYYDALIPRLRAGALLVVDNVLWGGRTVEPAAADADTAAIRAVNDRAVADPRVEVVLLPVADGLLLCRRR